MSLAEQVYLADMDPGDISSDPGDPSAIKSLYGCLNDDACYAQFRVAEETVDYFFYHDIKRIIATNSFQSSVKPGLGKLLG